MNCSNFLCFPTNFIFPLRTEQRWPDCLVLFMGSNMRECLYLPSTETMTVNIIMSRDSVRGVGVRYQDYASPQLSQTYWRVGLWTVGVSVLVVNRKLACFNSRQH